MRRITKFLGAVAVLVALGGFGASPASASDVTGHIYAFSGAIDCDFTMETSGPPPSPVTWDAATFAGYGITQPCGPDFPIGNDASIAFSGSGSNWTATISSLSLTEPVSACTLTTSGAISATSTAGVLGPYVGSPVNASGSGGSICVLLSTTVTLSNLVFS